VTDELLSLYAECEALAGADRTLRFSVPFRQSDPLTTALPGGGGERGARLREELAACHAARLHVYPLDRRGDAAWRAFLEGRPGVWWDFVVAFPADWPDEAPSVRALTPPDANPAVSPAGALALPALQAPGLRIADLLAELARLTADWTVPEQKPDGLVYLTDIRFVKILAPGNAILGGR
jgi:ubiquitin-protein ligase